MCCNGYPRGTSGPFSPPTRRGSCCPPLTPESSSFPPRQPTNAGIHLIADETAPASIQPSYVTNKGSVPSLPFLFTHPKGTHPLRMKLVKLTGEIVRLLQDKLHRISGVPLS